MIRPLLMVSAICIALSIPLSSPAQTPAAGPAPPTASAATPVKQTLDALFASEWQRGLRESQENASYSGDTRYNDRWSDYSPAAIAAREAADRDALAKLEAIDRTALAPADQLNYDTFAWQLEHSVTRQRFREWQQPVGHQGGPQTLDGIAEILPFKTEKDYADWLARLRAVPAAVTQAQVLMADGVKAGNLPPRVLMDRVPAQIALQVVDDPTRSPFYRPFLRMPDGFPATRAAALQAEAKDVIATSVVPAYRAFGTYFNDQYLPKTRTGIAASDLPDGRAYYDFLAGYYTTTDMTADAIHAIGLKEVARIRAEMEKVKAKAGFKGSMAAFFTFLRSDPQFFEKTPEALLQRYRATAKRIDPELVKVFRTLPRLPYGVRPIPDNIAPDTTTAYYQPGAGDGTRPGYYYVNLYKPETRPTWEMIPLSLHEAVPGHHFQFARGLELPGAPEFRRNAYFVAYGEGWGLYAEQLGTEMGLYDDPYDRMGQLAYEMWRAVRLVVDTGMHAEGWSRERAIEYFMANTPKTRQDAVNEIDRYIGTPAQALAYKIGQIRISQLRAKATKALGPAFDLRDFNDAVLETGSVPLDALERHIDAWIATKKSGVPGKAAASPAP